MILKYSMSKKAPSHSVQISFKVLESRHDNVDRGRIQKEEWDRTKKEQGQEKITTKFVRTRKRDLFYQKLYSFLKIATKYSF